MRSCVYSPQPEQGRRIWCKQYSARRSLLRLYPQGKLNSHICRINIILWKIKSFIYICPLFLKNIRKGRVRCGNFLCFYFVQNGKPCAWKGYLDSRLRCCGKSTKNINQLVRDDNLNSPDSALSCWSYKTLNIPDSA